jgi:hypothetical protein
MHRKLIVRNIIEGCFFRLQDNKTKEYFEYVSGEHDEDEVIVMAKFVPDDNTYALEYTPMCNIYPKEEHIIATEHFTMDLLPKQMKMFGIFWLSLIHKEITNIRFKFIKHNQHQLIECVNIGVDE